MDTNLNEAEKKVLDALYSDTMNAGGDFGFLDEVDRCGLTKHQFAGYIGSLRKKGAFEYIDNDQVVNGKKLEGQFGLNQEYLRALKILPVS